MITETQNKHVLRKTFWYKSIGFIIALIITIAWFGEPWKSFQNTVFSTIIFTFYYIYFEKYWESNIKPNYNII